jgi:hypothetical protein
MDPKWTPGPIHRWPPFAVLCDSLGLSPPNKTRQTRQLDSKLLIVHRNRMSSDPINLTWNPTNHSQEPDKGPI